MRVTPPRQIASYPQISEWGHRSVPPPDWQGRRGAAYADGDGVSGLRRAGCDRFDCVRSGPWKVVIHTPMGDRVTFDLKTRGEVSGSSDRRLNHHLRRAQRWHDVSWKSKVSDPIPMELEITANIDGAHFGRRQSPFRRRVRRVSVPEGRSPHPSITAEIEAVAP